MLNANVTERKAVNRAKGKRGFIQATQKLREKVYCSCW